MEFALEVSILLVGGGLFRPIVTFLVCAAGEIDRKQKSDKAY
jgi:hypothetical protein